MTRSSRLNSYGPRVGNAAHTGSLWAIMKKWVANISRDGRSARKSARTLFRMLGPGLVTGAADDDPSGIATYSQGGAQFGYALGWTMFLTTPFMIAIQLVS